MAGYGIDPYGLGPYGGGAPPVVLQVITPWPYNVVDERGGDVITLLGVNFAAPMTCEVLSGSLGAYIVEGECYMFDDRYDLTGSKAFFGTPPLPYTVDPYHLRVTNPSGSSIFLNALYYFAIAHELKPERNRSAWAATWDSGERYLRSTGGV